MENYFNKSEYKQRLIDNIVDEYLLNCGAICIEGPKWCGKTWTSAYHSKSFFYVGNPDNNFANRQLAIERPSFVLQGDKPRMIDEWQEVSALWDATRSEVDKINKNGQFILTGSSTPKNKGILHSGVGRIVPIRMSTMTLSETGDSTCDVSLKELCKGIIEEKIIDEISIEKLAYLIIRGGWPRNITNSNPTIMPKSYIEGIINEKNDDRELKFNSKTMELLLRSLARNESSTASVLSIISDIQKNDNVSFSKDTISKYIEILNRMFIINNQPPFSPNYRSPLRIVQSEKRHLSDPALACALLGLNTKKLIGDLNTMGFLFESLVEHDLYVYAQSMNAKLYHYRNYDGDEIDAILELEDGDWCAFEIKLGASKIDEAAANLNRICNKMIKNGMKSPSIKCVICGLSNAIIKRSDDVFVIPFTSLKD